MKKIMIIMISVALAGTASAQHFSHGGGAYYRPRIIVSGGFYPYFGFGYNPFYGYPYYPYGYGYNRPSKMTMQIQDIKKDYADKIWSAKHDTSLTRKERRMKVHELKVERDNAIMDLKHNYYKTN